MKRQRVLLPTANRANRRLLELCLAGDYQVLAAAEDNVLDIPFDLGILTWP